MGIRNSSPMEIVKSAVASNKRGIVKTMKPEDNWSMSDRQQFRRKRGDTRVDSIEKQYGVDLGARSDMKLKSYLKKEGLSSLSRALDEATKKAKRK